MDYLYYLFMMLAFIAVVLFLEGIYLIWSAYKGPEAVSIEKRLQSISTGWHGEASESTKLIKQRLLSDSPVLEHILMKVPCIHSIDRLLIQSGMQLNVTSFLGYIGIASLGGIAIASLLNLHFLFLLLCMAIGGLIPVFLIFSVRRKRLTKIEEQLPDTIDLMARALKAGHAFSAALQMVVSEAAEPIAGEFRGTFEEVNYGISVQEALMNLSTRIPITDLRYFVVAVLIQHKNGGNLAELLENISGLIRARLKLLGTIRVLSAEGCLSAWILSCLPFVLAFVIHLVNPGFLNVLFTDPAGPTLIGNALMMMAIGIYMMSRIVKIRV
ncbi:MAG: type II secretion system F family protein [Nitrosomonas sp.]|jgi:tight adherence protein B|uniref:type II secretion system F family protein n=1 Tax=Nitrosomonas sp. TaxID=42353 RepID=UPI0027315F9E|nr:type II secretion system F family protein [Nitrosomonas sp.]MDP1549289.1 type II secretion system F family protein [Nitrosomonas sp.]